MKLVSLLIKEELESFFVNCQLHLAFGTLSKVLHGSTNIGNSSQIICFCISYSCSFKIQPSELMPSGKSLNGTFKKFISMHVPWWLFPLFPPLPSFLFPSGYCQFVLYFHVSGYILLACLSLLIRVHLYVRSYGVCLSLPGLFHLAWCSPVPSMLLQRVEAPSFSLLHRIPSCKCTTVFLSTHLLMGT